jgi:hypothetical protein
MHCEIPGGVVELVPPGVEAGPAGPGASAHRAPLDAFCDEVFPALLRADSDKVGFSPTNSADFRKDHRVGRAFVQGQRRAVPG